jgi:hypothetical protein
VGVEREELSLNDAVTHLLEECRTVVPGMQALFGFQLIAVFNDTFRERLSPTERDLHLAAIVLVTIAVALLGVFVVFWFVLPRLARLPRVRA